MTHLPLHPLPSPEDPRLGDVIYLIDDDGRLDGRSSRVRTLVSESFDHEEEIFEVVDSLTQTRYIKRHSNVPTWREVFVF